MKLALVAAWVAFALALAADVLQSGPSELTRLYGEGALLAIGSLLVLLRRGNIIGTILVVMGTMWTIVIAVDASVETLADRGYDSAASWLALFFMMLTAPLLWLGNIAIWLVFPNGTPTTVRGARLLRFSAGYAVLLTLALLFAQPRILGPNHSVSYPHPFLDEDLAGQINKVVDLFFGPLFIAGFLAAGMLIARSRGSAAVERRQIAWVGLGYVLSNVIILSSAAVPRSATPAWLSLDSGSFFVVAVALGVAIFKHDLYDIDVIISKSVTYLGLGALITGLYVLVVVGPLLVIGQSDGGPGLLLPILATGAVAIVFEPVRTRMQHLANRLVYGERATPHEVLSRVTNQLADSTPGAGTEALARLLADGTGADEAVVWLYSGEFFTPDGVWQREGADSSYAMSVAELPSDDVTMSHLVVHQDEVFGGVTIVKPNADPVTPADSELISDVAAGSGLLLRNIRLNSELVERASEVRESRRRLIEAQDRERHRLERDLHDGAQQRVVALKVKLGIARTIAGREGADAIADRLEGLSDSVQSAVDDLRAVAHGIYPPLLESDGLQAALRAAERTTAIAIDLNAEDLERYGRSIEETAYFCVTETLERAHMSGATSARVAVAGQNGDLITEIDVPHLETELNLGAVADRIDAAGGTLRFADLPANGRSIVASLPIARAEGAIT